MENDARGPMLILYQKNGSKMFPPLKNISGTFFNKNLQIINVMAKELKNTLHTIKLILHE